MAAHQAGLEDGRAAARGEQADGTWRTAVEDIGIPVGRPQTIVVDLAGKLAATRRVRIVTTMRVYWDEAVVAAPADGIALEPRPLARRGGHPRASAASRPRRAPTAASRRATTTRGCRSLSPWKTMPGRYTRAGDVRPLLAAADDSFVVSQPGDELALGFDAAALPPLRPGWARTFLVHGDGFSKEMDINSASPDVVLPLPYHGMKQYPYAEAEAPAHVREARPKAEA